VPLTATGLIVAPVMEGDNEGNDSDSSVLGLGDSLALVPSSAEGGAPLAQGGEPEEIPSMALLPVKGAGLQARGGSGAGADLVGGGHAIVTSLAEPEEVVFPRSFDDGISERSAHGRAPAGVTTTTTSSDIVIGAPPTPAQVPARTTSGISSAEGMVVVAPAVHAYAPSPRLSLDRRQMSASIDRANSGFSSRELFSGGGIHDSMPVISPSAIARARRSRGAGSGFELHSASDLSVPHPGVPLPSDLEEGVVPFAHGWVPLQGREAPGATGALAKQGSGARSAPLFSSSSPRSGPVPGGDNPGPAQQRERQHVPEAAGNPGPEQSERQRVFEAALKDEHEVAEHLVRASVKAEAAADKMLAEAARPVAVPEPAAPGEVHSSSSSSSRPEPSPPGGLLMSIADGESGVPVIRHASRPVGWGCDQTCGPMQQLTCSFRVSAVIMRTKLCTLFVRIHRCCQENGSRSCSGCLSGQEPAQPSGAAACQQAVGRAAAGSMSCIPAVSRTHCGMEAAPGWAHASLTHARPASQRLDLCLGTTHFDV
jgi:hypothetical protein